MKKKANGKPSAKAKRETVQPARASTSMRSPRFWEYLDLADEGNEEAIADLFREFGFRYGVDEP